MGDSIVSIATRTYDLWNARDFDAFAAAHADDAELINVGAGQTLHGPSGAREFAEAWATAFPDGRVQIDRVIEAGNTVVVEFTGTGTHTGTLAGPAGDIPATGRQVTLHLCDIVDIADGKISRVRTYFDTASLLGQLGLMPTRAEATA